MDLDRAQTLWALGRFPYEDLPELAAQMMMQGHNGPAILELASFHMPYRPEIPPALVDRAFLETGRAPLDRDEATHNSVAHLLHSEMPASEILSEIWSLISGAFEVAFSDDPLSELARLAEDWDEAANDPLMREALEGHLPAVGRRYLDYFGKRR